MPREKIRTATEPFDLQVGWSRECPGVQVGITGMEGRSLVWLLYADHLVELGDRVIAEVDGAVGKGEGSEAIGRAVLNALDCLGDSGGEVPHYTGVWTDLDRAGVNATIRTLRKARDASFGRDE